MAKAKKQPAPQPAQSQAPTKAAIAPGSAPAAVRAAAQPAATQPAAPQPSATQEPAKRPPTAEAKPSKKSPAKKGAIAADAGKAAPKPAQKPAPPAAPIIDTNLAAATAASMVAHRDIAGLATAAAPATGAPVQPEPPRQESASFKQLKQGLNKPAASVGNLLGTPSGQKKSNLPFGGQKQSFRNQTFGADVNRSGVPRRTGG